MQIPEMSWSILEPTDFLSYFPSTFPDLFPNRTSNNRHPSVHPFPCHSSYLFLAHTSLLPAPPLSLLMNTKWNDPIFIWYRKPGRLKTVHVDFHLLLVLTALASALLYAALLGQSLFVLGQCTTLLPA